MTKANTEKCAARDQQKSIRLQLIYTSEYWLRLANTKRPDQLTTVQNVDNIQIETIRT